MTGQPDIAAKRQVSESALLFLHSEMVEYNLRGEGSKFYDVPTPTGEEGLKKQDSKNNKIETISVQESAKRKRLEGMGQEVGRRLAERHIHYRDKLEKDLDKVKFLCKDFWESTFRKQIDVLRTNHRGLYVLTDNNFRWFTSMSSPNDNNTSDKQNDANINGSPDDFACFPCGIICGALSRLGLKCKVTADLYPIDPGYRVSFNVQLIQS